jgi:hypothetical protein
MIAASVNPRRRGNMPGEIAEMRLDGTLSRKTCPHCKKLLKGTQGLRDHLKAKHPETRKRVSIESQSESREEKES